MGLESADRISQLNAAWPLGTDPKSEGDNHLRLIKSVMQADVVSRKEGGTFLALVTFTGQVKLSNVGGSMYFRNSNLAGNSGGWSQDIVTGGYFQIRPRDQNDDTLPDGGALSITRNPSGITDMTLAGPQLIATASTAASIVTRARGDARYTLSSSSKRFKDHILDLADLSLAFDDLRPVTWEWGGELDEDDPRRGTQGLGLIAEEVAELVPEAVVEGPEGEIEGLQPLALIGVLVSMVQDLRARLAAAGL